jgi:hypothetical protein
MNIKKRIKGPDVDWTKLDFVSKGSRPLSTEKMQDLKKMLPLVSQEAREVLSQLLISDSAEFLDDVDGFDAFEDDDE